MENLAANQMLAGLFIIKKLSLQSKAIHKKKNTMTTRLQSEGLDMGRQIYDLRSMMSSL